MEQKKAQAVIEAILFTMGDSVEVSRLATAMEMKEEEVNIILDKMEEIYRKKDRGISLIRLENAVQLCTKAELYEYLVKIAKTPRKMTLSDTLMETLSIIAYKQPVT